MLRHTQLIRLISSRCSFLCWLLVTGSLLITHRVHKMREELCEDTLAYDMEF